MEIRIDRFTSEYIKADRKERTAERTVYPFRILAVVLSVLLLIEVIGILSIQDLSAQRMEAERAYLLAEAENLRLNQMKEEVLSESEIENRARQDYGYVRNGEVVYPPVVEQ